MCERVGVRVFSLDGEHESCVRKVNEYVAALAPGVELSREAGTPIRAAPGLEDLLRAERPVAVVDFVHSARRIWGKFIDYLLKSGQELVSTTSSSPYGAMRAGSSSIAGRSTSRPKRRKAITGSVRRSCSRSAAPEWNGFAGRRAASP